MNAGAVAALICAGIIVGFTLLLIGIVIGAELTKATNEHTT